MNPWENDPVASSAGNAAQPWLADEEAQKRFTYQPPFTPAPPKSWLQKAGDFVAGRIKKTTDDLAEDTAKTESEMRQGRVYLGGTALGFVGGGNLPTALESLMAKGIRPAARTAAELANEAGYVLPPSTATAKPGTLASMTESLGGEAKTAQAASVKNQTVTNKLAAKSLGLPEGTALTDDVFEQVRGKAGGAYKAVADSGVPIKQDMAFVDDLLKVGKQSEEMAKYFPGLAKNDLIKGLQDELGTGQTFSAKAGIQTVRRLRAKASANLKNFLDPEKVELGRAQRGAADAIDDLIERNLSDAGKTGLVKDYRAARQTIAKAHDVESATNTATGNVNAQALAKLADKGKPLTGELKLIADTAKTFPKATQNPEKFGGEKKWSAVDAIAALAATHGHPGLLAGLVARPTAREIALSKLMQNRLARPKPAPAPNSLLSILRPTQAVSQPMVPTYGP